MSRKAASKVDSKRFMTICKDRLNLIERLLNTMETPMSDEVKKQENSPEDPAKPLKQEESIETASSTAEETPVKLTPEEELKELNQKYMYLYAEFENFKKRSFKEKSDLRMFGWESIALELLSVLDNMNLALKHAENSEEKAILDGIRMVQKMFEDTLKHNGVELVPSIGCDFDPNLHEAMGQIESDQPEGKIVEVQLEGYQIHKKLLRPAKVIVSMGKQKEKS